MRTIFKSHIDLSFTLKVNGVTRKVKFITSAMYGTKCESLFSADAELAEAMKKHPFNGVYYTVKEEVKGVRDNMSEAAKTKAIEDDLIDAKNAIIVENVTTKGMAIAYIQGMYGESFTATTVEDMKREAAKKWNTLFPKWGK
jgi:hypothetical protein